MLSIAFNRRVANTKGKISSLCGLPAWLLACAQQRKQLCHDEPCWQSALHQHYKQTFDSEGNKVTHPLEQQLTACCNLWQEKGSQEQGAEREHPAESPHDTLDLSPLEEQRERVVQVHHVLHADADEGADDLCASDVEGNSPFEETFPSVPGEINQSGRHKPQSTLAGKRARTALPLFSPCQCSIANSHAQKAQQQW